MKMMMKMGFILFVSAISTVTVGASQITVERSLYGHGFHRELKTAIKLRNKEELIKPPCGLLVSQTLPSGVYTDPFQLQSLAQFGGPQVLIDRTVDIEAAEYLSKRHHLCVYIDLSQQTVASSEDGKTLSFTLPIHGRYHKLSENADENYVNVVIMHPALYSNCSLPDPQHATLSAPCDASNSTECAWAYLSHANVSPVVKMSLPVGKASDKPIVITGTLIFSVVVCSLLCKVLWSFGSLEREKLL